VQVDTDANKVSDGSPRRTCPGISKLFKEFSFSIEYTLDEMIGRTLDWLQGQSEQKENNE
tara:strand:- start:50 stop:229 length:180 start_codon:yes stop_codon:yes gene_type:complete